MSGLIRQFYAPNQAPPVCGRKASRVGLTEVIPFAGIVGCQQTHSHGAALIIEGHGGRGYLRARGFGTATIGHILQPRHAA